jgi:hypothetical protein
MKYAIIVYLALGMVLSLSVGIEYHCKGQEQFPIYYGSPFVFKQTSLASSMEYFYSISGLLLNVLIWSSFLFIINKAIQFAFGKLNSIKWISLLYKIMIGLMIAFTTLILAFEWTMVGRGFGKDLNYWYWDIDKEAKAWGMTCTGEFILFRK